MTRTTEVETLAPHNNVLLSDADNYRDINCNVNARNGQKQNVESNLDTEASNRRTTEMTNFMDDLRLNSPKERQSRSRSKTCSTKRQSSSSSSSSVSSSSDSSSSRSRSRSWSRSRSRGRRHSYKGYRRCSRSYSRGRSRSRSRSYSPCQRRRYSPAYRRYYRSPPRYRSRSRSRTRVGSRHQSRYSRSRSRSRGRRYYGFVRRPYSPTFRSWRSRSRTRSRSRSPLRLSEKEKLELLEIAKMNAAKALGKEIELPESLKKDLKNIGVKNSEQSKNEDSKENFDKLRSRRAQSSSSNSSVRESGESVTESTVQKEEVKHKTPYMLWRPVTSKSKSFSNSLSPKHTHTSRAR